MIQIGASSVSGSIANRQMKHTTLSDRLSYNLYTAADYSIVWGTSASGGAVTLSNIKTPYTAVIYARIPAGQDVTIGGYLDSVTATITP